MLTKKSMEKIMEMLRGLYSALHQKIGSILRHINIRVKQQHSIDFNETVIVSL